MKNVASTFALALVAVACSSSSSSDGVGTAKFTTWGEEYIEREIPSADVEDGWTIRYDRFLVVLEDGTNTAANIAFDSGMNMVSVNNGFFTVCDNWIEPQTKHCTSPISAIAGTGYDKNDAEFGGSSRADIGGATAWLTTTAPATPGSTITLRFIIFDEGDAILDSAVLLDNFRWGGGGVTAPSTTVTVL